MKAKFYILFFLLFYSFSNCNSQNLEKTFKVEIVQNNKVIKVKNGVVRLKKKPFKYRITLYSAKYLDVSASFGKYFYDYPDEKNIYECNDNSFFKDCRFVSIKTGSESKFNEDKTLIIGEGDYHFNWFYLRTKDWHRYDKNVIVKEDKVIAEKTIENILDVELRKTSDHKNEYDYTVENIKKDIYMVFATSHYESGMKHPKELQREKFVIKFK
jgi:hypothetical protein